MNSVAFNTTIGLLVLVFIGVGTFSHAPSDPPAESVEKEKGIVARDKIVLYENAAGYRRAANTNPEAGDLLIVPCRLDKTESIVVAAYLYFASDNTPAVFTNLKPAAAIPGLYRSEYPDLIGSAKADASYAIPEHDHQESNLRNLSIFLPYSQLDEKVAGRSAHFSYRLLVFRPEGKQLKLVEDLKEVGGIRSRALAEYKVANQIVRRIIGLAH